MPPNRKNVQGLVQTLSSGDLEGLQDAIQPKYQPLTHPSEETKHLAVVATKDDEGTAATEASHDSYWDWPADQDMKQATIRRILEDEKAREIVSGANIETIETIASSTKEGVSEQNAENDDYWSWNSPQVASHVVDPSHPNNNYWDWDGGENNTEAKKKESQIQAILEYEAARERMSADHIVHNLQQESSAITSSGGLQSSSDDYWGW